MDYLNKLADFDIPYIIVGIVIMIMVLKFLFEVGEWFLSKFGIEFKALREKKEKEEQINKNTEKINQLETEVQTILQLENKISEITNGINDIKTNIDILKNNDVVQNNALVETLHDRIMQKCIYYINTLKGLPFDEKDELIRLFDAYTKLGGNHHLNLTVEYCLNTLPLLTITRKINQTESENTEE